ncbi:hypothetical protein BGZ75_009873 [Mortierella antarctica]|nr:hypothetical protein BGZ75_009873 [Mortierella antarctica]
MQASGAKAVIVGDNQRSGLITMYAREDTSDVLIPSVFIAQHHYRELRFLGTELGKGFKVALTPDDMNWPVLDVIIFIILSPAFVVLFLYFIWRIRLRQHLIADLAPTEVVSNLPIKVFYSSKVKENDPVECVICLDDFEDETELRVLPCKHEYHVACIDNWLTTRKKFCPICKRDICTPTETTPLLGSSNRTSSNNNHDTRTNTHNSAPSTSATPSTLSSASSSSSSSAAGSSSAAALPPRSGSRLAVALQPQRHQRSQRNVRAAVAPGAGAGTRPADVTVPMPNTTVPVASSAPAQLDLSSEEEVLRRV